jgi:hypothetical protein
MNYTIVYDGLNDKHKDNCMCIQIGNMDFINELLEKYELIEYLKIVDIYINFIDDMDLSEELLKKLNYPNIMITKSENRGMDMGQFIIQIEMIKLKNIKYDYIVKIHSKTHELWKKAMMESIFGENNTVSILLKILILLKQNPTIGLYGHRFATFNGYNMNKMNILVDYFNLDKLICSELGVNRESDDDLMYEYPITSNNFIFVPGSIFIVKVDAIKQMFDNSLINIYNMLEINRVDDCYLQKLTHGFERIFGLLYKYNGYFNFDSRRLDYIPKQTPYNGGSLIWRQKILYMLNKMPNKTLINSLIQRTKEKWCDFITRDKEIYDNLKSDLPQIVCLKDYNKLLTKRNVIYAEKYEL